jgi:hypothetical protein
VLHGAGVVLAMAESETGSEVEFTSPFLTVPLHAVTAAVPATSRPIVVSHARERRRLRTMRSLLEIECKLERPGRKMASAAPSSE